METERKGKFSRILDEFKQYFEEGRYLNHYLANCVSILLERDDYVDFRLISHKNLLIRHDLGFDRFFGIGRYSFDRALLGKNPSPDKEENKDRLEKRL